MNDYQRQLAENVGIDITLGEEEHWRLDAVDEVLLIDITDLEVNDLEELNCFPPSVNATYVALGNKEYWLIIPKPIQKPVKAYTPSLRKPPSVGRAKKVGE